MVLHILTLKQDARLASNMCRSNLITCPALLGQCTSFSPGEPLIQKCRANIHAGCQPIIITIYDRVKTALDLAAVDDLSGRIEVWDIQQFLSTNISEHSIFDSSARNAKLADIIEKYNAIIAVAETDPSLRIEFEAK